MSAGGVKNGQGLRVSIGQSVTRQTPKTDFGSVVAEGAARGANVVLETAKVAAPFIPGGAVLSAAVSSIGQIKSSATVAMGANSSSVGNGPASVGGNSGSSGSSSVSADVDALAGQGDKNAIMFKAQNEMQEMNRSFNMQYLQLQQKMQSENRQFTTLSNVMKTRHDTAKNAISNVR